MSKYFIFITVSLGLLLGSISGSSVSVAFPQITESFNTSLIMAGWVLSIYQLASTAIMPLIGKAGDIWGGKRLFLATIALFTVGSLFCAIAPNIELLILARLIQAIGGGGLFPIAAGIVAEQFPESRQQAIGFFSSILPIGSLIGPNLGGWMIQTFGWESIFWFNVPIGIIILIISFFTLKNQKTEGGKIDLLGAGLFSGVLSALMAALGQLGVKATSTSWIIPTVLFIAAIVFAVLFWRHEQKASNPIIDLQVLTEKPFVAANIFNFFIGTCGLGALSFVPLYCVSVFTMSTIESGLILTPRSIGMIFSSFLTSMFMKKWGYRMPMLLGSIVITFSLILLGIQFNIMNLVNFQLSATMFIGTMMLLMGIGMGMVSPAANNACIDLMPNRVATITGVRGMFRQTGGALCISVITLLLQKYSNNIGMGFKVMFLGVAGIQFLSILLIFMMPNRPVEPISFHDI